MRKANELNCNHCASNSLNLKVLIKYLNIYILYRNRWRQMMHCKANRSWPLHVFPSGCRVNPTGQLHRTPVAVSLQVRSQPPLLTAHVSAEWKRKRERERGEKGSVMKCSGGGERHQLFGAILQYYESSLSYKQANSSKLSRSSGPTYLFWLVNHFHKSHFLSPSKLVFLFIIFS